MKYISNGKNIVIFSEGLTHKEVAISLQKTYFGQAQSAGFIINIGLGKLEEIKTVGESVSLNLKSNPEDAEIFIRDIRGY